MRFLISWLHRVLSSGYLAGLRRAGNLDEIERQLRRTDRRFLDAQSLQAFAGISYKEAADILAEAAESGELVKRYQYSATGIPVVYLSVDEVGKNIRLKDLGFIGDDEGREVFINPNDVREVFIEPGAA
jgi:hypothetical protein